MKKYIVITSIFEPTEGIKKFSGIDDFKVIVVGDKRSPLNWECHNVDYISVIQQGKLDYLLVKSLPYNHYSRKMVGYLRAIQNGADYIIDTDDDNIPKVNWKFPEFKNKFDFIAEGKEFVNIYQLYSKQKIWPRGFPLSLITTQFDIERNLSFRDCNIGVWQGLADEDPDVDAIYRLTNNTSFYFEERAPVVLGKGTICPFNSQNTMIRKELFPLLYLPTSVSFRFTDILRGLVAQPIMWLYDYQLGFTGATVVQERHLHDFFQDFISEIPMYKDCEKVINLVSKSISKFDKIEANLFNAYNSLLINKIVSDNEMVTLECWLKDLEKYK